MTDERLFERLAAHAGPADIDPGFEDRLYALLQQEMGRSRRSSRPILLLVAALLAILAISAAAAVGSGLIEVPWFDDDRSDGVFPLAGPTARCDQTLAEGVLLTVIPLNGGHGPNATQLTVYENGLVVTGFPTDWGAPATVGLEGTWSQRRLTAEGLSALMGAVTSSLPSCQSFEFDGQMAIRARDGAEVFSIDLGQSVLETRPTTPAQADAAKDLADRLRDPDLGLAASEWADDQWHPYFPQRWRFTLQFSGGLDLAYPTSDGVLLPDGSTLQTFGAEEPDASDLGWTMVRCGAVDTAEALAIAAILTDAGAGPADSSLEPAWHFINGPLNPDEIFHSTITVSVVGLLPHEPDCLSDAPAGLPPAEPGPSASGPAPLIDACDYLPNAVIGDVIGPVGATEHYPEWSADWAFCWQQVAGDELVIFASRRSFPGERAVDQAGSLFGDDGFNAEQIAGRDVFFNGCEADDPCRSAVAISAEPHLVVITWQAGSQATLRQLTERLIRELDARD